MHDRPLPRMKKFCDHRFKKCPLRCAKNRHRIRIREAILSPLLVQRPLALELRLFGSF